MLQIFKLLMKNRINLPQRDFQLQKDRNYITESDHNTMVLDVKLHWSSRIKQERVEIYNLRNSDCQQKFFTITNNGKMLTNCLINRNIKEGGKIWIKSLKLIILQNFKKIRMKKHKNKIDLYISKLIENKRLANEHEKLIIEKEIAEKIFERNRKVILDQVGDMVDNSSNMSRLKVWKVKQN